MGKVTVEVTGAAPVDGHPPGASFTVDSEDARLRAWVRGRNVTVKPPKKRAKKTDEKAGG